MNSKMFQIRIAACLKVHTNTFYVLKTVQLANLKDTELDFSVLRLKYFTDTY